MLLTSELRAHLRRGVFEAHGVLPVHTELDDAGVLFGAIKPLSCVIHDCRFSPANCNIQLGDAGEAGIAWFLSVCVHPVRGDAVIVQHVLPVTDAAQARLQAHLDTSVCFDDVLRGLREDGLGDIADVASRFYK